MKNILPELKRDHAILQLKLQINALREQKKKRTEICQILNCSISEYTKALAFKSADQALQEKVERFKASGMKAQKDFSYIDVINKFGLYPSCYLTGRKRSYRDLELDHIIPRSQGGSSELENMGLLCHFVNQMKGSFLLPDFINEMKLILTRQGYKISE